MSKNHVRLKHYLEREPRARERRNKDRAIVNILRSEFPELKNVSRDTLIEAVKQHNSLDRSWRRLLQENPSLRGEDYQHKAELVRRQQLELGYDV